MLSIYIFVFFQILFVLCHSNETLSFQNLPTKIFVENEIETLRIIRHKILEASYIRPEIFQAYHSKKLEPNMKIPLSNMSSQLQLQQQQPFRQKLITQCSKDLLYTSFELLTKKQWAIEMMDSFSKPPSGILRGQVWWTGNYDECLKVEAPPSNPISVNGFRGRYAWLNVTLNTTISRSPVSINIGACLPDSCENSGGIVDFADGLFTLLSKLPIFNNYLTSVLEVALTFSPIDNPLSPASICCICLCGVFVFLVILGTIVDLVQRKKFQTVDQSEFNCSSKEQSTMLRNGCHEIISTGADNESDAQELQMSFSHPPSNPVWQKILLCFSAIRNTEAVLNTSSVQGHLLCFHGIRVISMGWLLLGETMYFGVLSFENIMDLFDMIHNWPIQLVLQAGLSVDTFFLIGGCLLTYHVLKKEQYSTFKQWLGFFVHRYIRLTPAYAMLLFIMSTWWNNLSSGPFWTLSYRDVCVKNWWWNMLYIHNILNALDMCMNWTFFSASEMQYFLISPLFLLAFRWKRAAGIGVVLVLLVASWIITGIIASDYHLKVLYGSFGNATDYLPVEQQQRESFDMLFTKPHTRIGPYLIGVLLGFILKELNGRQKFLSKSTVILGWAVSQTLSLLLIYGLGKVELGPITASTYSALGRSAWALSVAWIIFACLTGHAGFIDILLSWKVWIPFSRLTYSAYLVHAMIMLWYYDSLKTTIFFSIHHVGTYVGFVVLSYGMAFIIFLLIERPFINLEKLLRN